ncbi:MAG: polysaccharide biosynthesis tyrosine autokinase [Mucilaginibacter polytrichastri]|nr:polysaccharide biosynthesis tyrosine autokinase [Mucilaginibacter polytrichastri]
MQNVNSQETALANDGNVIDLRLLLYKFFENWKMFLLSVLIFIAIGLTYIYLTNPTYSISGEILIKDNSAGPGNSSNDLTASLNLFAPDKIIDNEIEILKSHTLIEQVVKDLGLSIDYYEKQNLISRPIFSESPFECVVLKPTEEAYKDEWDLVILDTATATLNGKKIELNKPVYSDAGILRINLLNKTGIYRNKEYTFKIKSLGRTVSAYQKNLQIAATTKNSTVISLTIEDEIPERGQMFIKNLFDAYNQAAIDDKRQVAAYTLKFLDDRLKLLTGQLDSVETNVERYKSQQGITDVTEQSKSFLASVQESDAALAQIDVQLSVIGSIESYLASPDNGKGKFPAVIGIEDPVLPQLLQQLSEMQLQRQTLLNTTSEGNPKVKAIDENINSLEGSVRENVRNIRQNLLSSRKTLAQRNADFESVIKNVPAKEKGLIDVTRQREIMNSIYQFLLQKREESALSYASTVSDSRTIDLPRSTDDPVKPKKVLVILIAIMAGMIIPAGIIGIRNALDDKITHKSDIENAVGAPIVGEISFLKEDIPVIVRDKPRSIISEQIRSLRTNMQYIGGRGKEIKTIIFTSSISGEGKSFVSLNLGASLALTDSKVIILELDLRKPKLHKSLNMHNNAGLSTYLIGKASVESIVQPIEGFAKYDIITCGPIPPNPAELVLNGRMTELIEDLKTRYDYVIIDAPPVGLVTDAQIMADLADISFYVIRHGYTIKQNLPRIQALYAEKKFPNMSIIINAISEQSSYGHNYGYGFTTYGGKYSYYEDEEEPKGMFSGLKKRFGKKGD